MNLPSPFESQKGNGVVRRRLTEKAQFFAKRALLSRLFPLRPGSIC
jgi:hypothetical protein